MEISSLGKDSFKIKVKGGSAIAADSTVAVLHKGETGKGFLISDPGEYEIEGISVFGYPADSGAVFVVQAEDLRCLYLGGLSKPFSEKLSGEIENIDVVILPTEKLSTKEATEIAAKLEPYYVIPYGAGAEKFIAAYEHGSKTVKSLSLGKGMLPEDLTEVIVFE